MSGIDLLKRNKRGGYSGSSGGGSYHSGRFSSRSNLVGKIVFGVNAVLITCGRAVV
nr:hypothetical protein [uncultured Blautia sp.]